ncbi:MAG TPA: prolyl oligopeptidase family serine peptidase [Planctomycetota bacterium]|nr:prolyl oligopeptidase family serine peptidase [Planctomycetota bacterium]
MMIAMELMPLPAGQPDWTPTKDATKGKGLEAIGRSFEVFQHETKPDWGYKSPQKDTFIVVHPRTERKGAPLYVVLHSAGHDVLSCAKCTAEVGNHDIYRSPDDFYALYLDCSANRGDWWWGGMHLKDEALIRKNSGGDPTPVERRVIDTVKWVIKTYAIDPNRVYLCGNSMGGSGTLGIGMRHGDVFAAIKANVPAGIEHVSHRMYFPPKTVPTSLKIPDPPVAVDYSAPNDSWSAGHERFVQAMNDRKYALYFYWGPFGHANNSEAILRLNDLINSFDWLNVRKNEAYAVFTNASDNSRLPWPDSPNEKAPGQVNAFFLWKNISDEKDKFEVSLFLRSPADLKTTFHIPEESTADVSLRRIQNFHTEPGESIRWTFGAGNGVIKSDPEGVLTIPGLKLASTPTVLTLRR